MFTIFLTIFCCPAYLCCYSFLLPQRALHPTILVPCQYLLVAGQKTGIPMPLWLLSKVSVINQWRIPMRFMARAMLGLALYAGAGLEKVVQSPRIRSLTPVFIVLCAFEGEARLPAVYAPLMKDRNKGHDEVLLELPLGFRDGFFMWGKEDTRLQYYQTYHHRNLVNGFVSRLPQARLQAILSRPFLGFVFAGQVGRIPHQDQECSILRRDERALGLIREDARTSKIRYLRLRTPVLNSPPHECLKLIFNINEPVAQDGKSLPYRLPD